MPPAIEIVKAIISNNANSVILAHVHPGGSLQPSGADIEVTKKIIAALKTINVSVIDHIIVAENSFTSFAEKGLLNSWNRWIIIVVKNLRIRNNS